MRSRNISGLCELEYAIKKPFPNPRAIWAAMALGAVILGTLFGFVAVATNAYVVQSVYTADPNTTEAEIRWFQKQPFAWFGSLKTSCEDSTLSPAETFMTTNRGFVYTMDKIWMDGNGTHQRLPQISYHNSTMSNCVVLEIKFHLARIVQHDNKGQWWTWGNSAASAVVQCDVYDSYVGPVHATFTITLPRTYLLGQVQDMFLSQQKSDLQSMWYGIQLTSQWHSQVATTMAFSIPTTASNDSWSEGSITLRRNRAIADWRSLDYFTASCEFLTERGWNAHEYGDQPFTMKTWADSYELFKMPKIYEPVDAFGKAFYSLLSIDFGIRNDSNALTSQAGVRYLLQYNNTVAKEGSRQCKENTADTTPDVFCANGDLSNFNISDSVDLTPVPSSRLMTQYLCSVPRQKSQISIAYSVMLAILVFVSSLWSLSRTILELLLVKTTKEANYCVGCTATKADLELIHRPSRTVSDSFLAGNDSYITGTDEDDSLLPYVKHPNLSHRASLR